MVPTWPSEPEHGVDELDEAREGFGEPVALGGETTAVPNAAEEAFGTPAGSPSAKPTKCAPIRSRVGRDL